MRRNAARVALLLCFAAGCARLPEYARPKVEVVGVATLAITDGIAYRKLTRDDFRAKDRPNSDSPDAERLSAFTCAYVVPHGEFLMDVRQDSVTGTFIARPRTIAFVATMDRDCSWWNPKQTGAPTAYVLQHEQIHFAIAEAAAHDLSSRSAELSASGDSFEAAQAALQRATDALIRAAEAQMGERNLRFDADTSGRYEPDLQQRWYDELNTELTR